MALDKDTLEAGLTVLFAGLDADASNEDKAQSIASGLTTLIEEYIKSGELTTTITGTVDGSSVTGTGTGNLT